MSKHFLRYPKRNVNLARKLRREMTDAERKMWSRLRGNQLGVHFRRQVPFGPYILDFLSIKAKLAVEVDGGQHYTEAGIKRDEKRDRFLNGNGITVLRFSDPDVLKNIDEVAHEIWEHVQGKAE